MAERSRSDSLPETESPVLPLLDERGLGYVRVLFDFKAESPTEIGLKKGDIIRLLATPQKSDWWGGEKVVPNQAADSKRDTLS